MTLAHDAARIMMEFKKKKGDTLPIGVLADMGNLTWILKHTVPVSAIFFVPVGGPFILNPSSTYF